MLAKLFIFGYFLLTDVQLKLISVCLNSTSALFRLQVITNESRMKEKLQFKEYEKNSLSILVHLTRFHLSRTAMRMPGLVIPALTASCCRSVLQN